MVGNLYIRLPSTGRLPTYSGVKLIQVQRRCGISTTIKAGTLDHKRRNAAVASRPKTGLVGAMARALPDDGNIDYPIGMARKRRPGNGHGAAERGSRRGVATLCCGYLEPRAGRGTIGRRIDAETGWKTRRRPRERFLGPSNAGGWRDRENGMM